jgi:hypothetical protein
MAQHAEVSLMNRRGNLGNFSGTVADVKALARKGRRAWEQALQVGQPQA